MTWRKPILSYTNQDWLDQAYLFSLQEYREYYFRLKYRLQQLNHFSDDQIDELLQVHSIPIPDYKDYIDDNI